MSKAKRKKPKHIANDGVEQENERETGDIYDDKQRGDMLRADRITAAEKCVHARKRGDSKKEKTPTHKDTVSVQLAEDEYEED